MSGTAATRALASATALQQMLGGTTTEGQAFAAAIATAFAVADAKTL